MLTVDSYTEILEIVIRSYGFSSSSMIKAYCGYTEAFQSVEDSDKQLQSFITTRLLLDDDFIE